MEKKTLTLNLKKKWYDMIESGEKKEEYREIKDYWKKRLVGKDYDYVTFVYGYTKRKMTFKVDWIHVGIGKPEWGAPSGFVYVIRIGEKIEDDGK